MLNRLLTYLKYGNSFCGIEHSSKNGSDIIYGIQLKQSKGELNIESSFEEKTIEDASNKLAKNQNLTLVINNDKVLSKFIESDQQDTLKLVYKVFPNANLNDFYFEILSQKNNHFVSLCRKDYVDNIIKDYEKHKISVINFSLGNNLIKTITNFIKQEGEIFSSNSKIQLKNNHIVQIEKAEVITEDYVVNSLNIFNSHSLALSGALQPLLNNQTTLTNFSEEKNRLTNEFKQTRFFNQFLKLGGLFILGLLLVNFFFFNHYFNKVNELKQLSEINQTTKSQIIKLKESVSKKQKMVDDLLKSNGSKTSFYSNQIIKSLPFSILLSEFDYQPLLKRIKAEKEIELENNIITASGTSSDSKIFSSWVNQLEQQNWINKVDIIDYGSTSSNTSDFKIKIVLADE